MRTGRATVSTSPARRAISPRCSDATRRSCSRSASATASSSCTRREPSPTRDFIGIEVHRPGVGRLLNALADAQRRQRAHLSPRRGRSAASARSRRIAGRSAHLFSRSVAEEAPSKAAPDPARVRRARSHRASTHGGRLHLATDWADYAEHMQSVLDNAPDWRRTRGAGDVVVASGMAHRHALRTPRREARPRRLGSRL